MEIAEKPITAVPKTSRMKNILETLRTLFRPDPNTMPHKTTLEQSPLGRFLNSENPPKEVNKI